ncbi:N-acetylglucosamine-6-phosphate deacetylase, partial [Streptomyces scabiei]
MATPSGARQAATHPQVLTGARVVLPTGTVPDGRVTVDGTKIAPEAAQGTARVIDVRNHWLVPGFVDLHNHGGGGASFSGTAE